MHHSFMLKYVLCCYFTAMIVGCTSVQYTHQEREAKFDKPVIDGLLVVTELENHTDKSYTHNAMFRPVNPVGSLSKAVYDTIKDYNVFEKAYYYSTPISENDVDVVTNKFDRVTAVLQGECELYKWNAEARLLTRGSPQYALALVGVPTLGDTYVLGLNYTLRLINPSNGKIIWMNTFDRQFKRNFNKNFWMSDRKNMSHIASQFIDEAMEEVFQDLIENIGLIAAVFQAPQKAEEVQGAPDSVEGSGSKDQSPEASSSDLPLSSSTK